MDQTTANRVIVGTLAPTCFVAALVIWLVWPDETLWWAGGLRCGLVLTALWWALPGRGRKAAWANVSPWAFVGLAVMLALVPKYWRVLVPLFFVVMIAGLVLRPKKKQRPGGPY